MRSSPQPNPKPDTPGRWAGALATAAGAQRPFAEPGERSRRKRAEAPTPVAPGTGEPTATALAPPPYIQVGRQVIGPVGQIVIPSVHAPNGGWLALHEDGPDGPVLAQRWLLPGVSNAVSYSLETEALPAELWAVLHEDNGAPGRFEYPGADPIVLQFGEIVAELFGVEVITPTPWHTPTPRPSPAP